MSSGAFHDLFDEARTGETYWTERAVLDFTEELSRLMDEHDVNRAELARRIGARPSYITKVLDGNANFTLKTMTKLARALGTRVAIHLAPADAITHWVDDMTAEHVFGITPQGERIKARPQAASSNMAMPVNW